MTSQRLRTGMMIAVLMMGTAAMTPAFAQGFGIRAGVSGDPDQFYFGGHYEPGRIAEHLWFRPNVEIGVGHDVTVVTGNIEFVDKMQLGRSEWSLYFGGGPALVIADTDRGTDSGGGFNLLIDLEHRRGLFTEFKVGLADSPEVKIGVGYTFH